jgi:hypothetical protein
LNRSTLSRATEGAMGEDGPLAWIEMAIYLVGGVVVFLFRLNMLAGIVLTLYN